jgi:hypothetical protein
MQPGQQKLVQLLPYSGLMPVPQPPPAGHARAQAGLLRQELPGDAGAEHEQDARQEPSGHPDACGPDDRRGNGSIRARNSSGTIHGGCSPFLARRSASRRLPLFLHYFSGLS